MDINEELENIDEDDLLEALKDIEIPAGISSSTTDNSAKVEYNEIDTSPSNSFENDLDNMLENITLDDKPANETYENKTVEVSSSNCDKILDILKELLSKKRIDITIRVRS